jgi:hypothetical protein
MKNAECRRFRDTPRDAPKPVPSIYLDAGWHRSRKVEFSMRIYVSDIITDMLWPAGPLRSKFRLGFFAATRAALLTLR